MRSDTKRLEHAAKMADRFHFMCARTLKAMLDHRRYSLVVIANAKNVNIATARGQQINLTKSC